MTKKFKIEHHIAKNTYDQKCWECDKKILNGSLCVKYSYANYHLSCFKRYGNKLLKRWKLFEMNMQEHLNKLEPYQKEMICETLEQE